MELQGRIPTQFGIRIPIIAGVLDAEGVEVSYGATVLLSMDIDQAVSFKLSCPALPLIEHQARLDAVAYLKRLLGGEFMVGLGDLKAEAVPSTQAAV